MARVLLVEDDDDIAEPLGRALSRSGHVVDRVATGREAEERVGRADLVVLDVGLPDIDGFEVVRRIRRRGATIPVLLLTARSQEIDKVVGLDAGADDYLTKPFGLAELEARIRALLRRTPAAPASGEAGGTSSGDDAGGAAGSGVHAAGSVVVDLPGRRASVDGRPLELTVKEFDLLALLVREAGTVVRREHILEEVWDAHWYGPTKTLDVHVSSLRRKLGDDAEHGRFITTVRGVGYRFEAG